MANAQAKLYYTKQKYLDSLPVANGNIIFVPESNMVCLDMSDQRFYYHTIKIFATEEERLETPFPNEGFYYVEQTGVIWRWKDTWRQITPRNIFPIYYGDTEEDFPEEGENNLLYYTDNGIYNWKKQLNEYNLIANANRWRTVQ